MLKNTRRLTVNHRTLASLISLLALVLLPAAAARAALVTITLSPNWLSEGTEQGGDYGYAVAYAGDLNQDGYDDVLVGADRDSTYVYRAGAVFLFIGGPAGLSRLPVWSSGGSTSGERYGSALAGGADYNADSYPDIAIGAYRYNEDNPDEGAVFVFYGGPDGLAATPDWAYQSDQTNAQFGYSLAAPGDINCDGYDDLLVGARWYSNPQEHEGAVLVFYGGSQGLETTPAWSYESNQPGASLGTSVSGGYASQADACADVLVGAPYYKREFHEEGAAYLFPGSASGPPAEPSWSAFGGQEEAWFGASVAWIGDADLDGYADLAIGAPQVINTQWGRGSVYLFAGQPGSPAQTPYRQLGLVDTTTGFGRMVAAAGDVNQDGFADLAIGDYLYTTDQQAEGAAFVHIGGPDGIQSDPAWMAEGNKADTWFGHAVASAGDVNQDGYSDLIVGAPEFRQSTTLLGRVFLYHGREPGDAVFRQHLALLQRGAPGGQR